MTTALKLELREKIAESRHNVASAEVGFTVSVFMALTGLIMRTITITGLDPRTYTWTTIYPYSATGGILLSIGLMTAIISAAIATYYSHKRGKLVRKGQKQVG